MASDCRIGCRLNLTQAIILKVMVILCVIIESVHAGLYFNCTPVEAAKKCICGRSDYRGYEINCPNDPLLEQYPISLTVTSDNSDKPDDATLIITCVLDEQDFPWNLIGGLDLNRENQGFRIVRLSIQYCSQFPITDGFEGLFKNINLNPLLIKRFYFRSHIDSENTKSIPTNFFSQMKNLEGIDLAVNNLHSFPSFTGLAKLNSLFVDRNQLVRIPRDAFSSNKNLEKFNLLNNKITKVEKASFPESTVYLDLQSNQISTLTFESFANLKNLQILHLDGNPLDNVDINTFHNLLQLKELSLKNTRLKEFPMFVNLPNLKSLIVSHPGKTLCNYNAFGEKPTTTLPPTDSEGFSTTSPEEGEISLEVSLRNLPSLEKLILINLRQSNFTTLENLPALTNLTVSGNSFESYPAGYFKSFPNLTNLDLSRNEIATMNILGFHLYNIKSLDLHCNQIDALEKQVFDQLGNLKALKLSRNKIEVLSKNVFESLSELEELDLSRNNMTFKVPPKSPTNDTVTNENGSVLSTLQSFGAMGSTSSPLNYCQKLVKVDLSFNRIDMMYDDWRLALPSITKLNLSHNKFKTLYYIDFNIVSASKIDIDLRNNDISTVHMEQAKLVLDPLTEPDTITVKLGNSHEFNCDCQAFYLKSFDVKGYKLELDNLECQTPHTLIGQMLANVDDEMLICKDNAKYEDKCDCWRRPKDQVIGIDCSNRNLSGSELPDFSNDAIKNCFKEDKWEIDLNLSGNSISELNNTFMASLSQRVRMVDLTNNNLESLRFLESVRSTNATTFSLSSNPFPCEDCPDFQILWRTYARRIADFYNMTCVSNEIETRGVLLSLNEDEKLEKACPPPMLSGELRGLVIAVTLLLLIVIILVAVYIRHGWAIRAFLYSKGLGCCLCYDQFDDEDDKPYDAFVSYSHKDEEWVLNELVNRLEGKDGFKLCLHFRDWTPGDWIPDQIVRSVDDSRRTVVVLSKNFVESIWSRMEFKTAHSQALTEKSNRLILILMGDDLTDDDVKDDDLKVYMKMNTYLKWNDPWFWHKLKYALPHRKNAMEENRNILLKREQRERAIKLDKLRAKYEQNI